MSDETALYIIDSVNQLAARVSDYRDAYLADPRTARFKPRHEAVA